VIVQGYQILAPKKEKCQYQTRRHSQGNCFENISGLFPDLSRSVNVYVLIADLPRSPEVGTEWLNDLEIIRWTADEINVGTYPKATRAGQKAVRIPPCQPR